MRLKSWGNYPHVEGENYPVVSDEDLTDVLTKKTSLIVQGNNRSYGDSAFAQTVIDMKARDHFLDFDTKKGILELQAGALISDVLESIVPKGWILPVLPGTQLITIGGAIASDIHGKNHHNVGTFCQFVKSLRLMLSNGEIIKCSNTENVQAFHATCAGMGLTGIILDATIQLSPISSNRIKQTSHKTINLKHTFEIFDENNDSSYSVAWIDCLAKDQELGKSIVMLGEHETEGELGYKYKSRHKMPFYLPSFVLNSWSIRLFNWLYYFKAKNKSQSVQLQSFFFPLDSIVDWNKMYGKSGFVQYQCVIPLEHSYEGIKALLNKISESKQGSFLAVLKRMGCANDNLLSFPMEGYSLALDFKVNKKTLELLDTLDEIVKQYNGRLYLCKDARMSEDTLNHGYKNAEKFRKFRQDTESNKTFNSHQSTRLKL